MTPVAVYDANVLYPSALRDFLIRVAIEDLVHARWSDRILDEVFRNIEINRPDLDRHRLLRTRQRMCAAVLDCLVSGFEDLEPAITLPDPDDRHVVAAAIRAGAGIVVTFNLRDFPDEALARHGVVAMHPDLFAMELLARNPTAVLEIVSLQATDLKSPWTAVTRRGGLAVLALSAVVVGGNAIVAAHAWRFTHFAADGVKTGNPEALSKADRVLVALTGVVVPRPGVSRHPREVGLDAAIVVEAGVSTWAIPGSGRGTALLFHGYGGAKSDLIDEAAALNSSGWTTVLVDFPGSGESPGNTTSLGWAEADVVTSLARAHQDEGPLVIFGKSMGSAAVLRAVGVLGAPADALVLENPYDRLITTVGHRFEAMGLPAQPGAALLVFWGGLELGFNGFTMNPVEFASKIQAPTLLLNGERVPRVHLAEVEAIRASLAGAAELVVFPGAGHVGLYSADTALWRSSVTGFLDREAPNSVSDSNSRNTPATP